MIQKVKLKKIYISDQDKNGNKFISKKTNKPFQKIAIMIDEYPNKYLSSFINSSDDVKLMWKIGDEVSIKIEQNGEWLNFSTPTNFDILKDKVYELEDRIRDLEDKKEIGKMYSGRNIETQEIQEIVEIPF